MTDKILDVCLVFVFPDSKKRRLVASTAGCHFFQLMKSNIKLSVMPILTVCAIKQTEFVADKTLCNTLTVPPNRD